MDLLQIAEENFLITFGIVCGVGLLQGAILARGIRRKYPKFADPSKVSVTEFEIPQTPEGAFTVIIDLLGLNAGVLAVIGIFVTISLILIFKFADISPIARYFIFTISVIVLIVSLLGRFTDYVPTVFQIILYSIYQLGLTIVVFLVMRRKVKDSLEELE